MAEIGADTPTFFQTRANTNEMMAAVSERRAKIRMAGMITVPMVLCLIVLAAPLAVAVCAVFAAWAERRLGSAQAYRLNAMAGDGFDDDSGLFQ
jgi:hypothetical protein